MDARPTKLAIENENVLVIDWSDDSQQKIPMRELRKACPCATCNEERENPPEPQNTNMLPILKPGEEKPLRIDSMRPVGNYGYSIAFTDGHRNGIFTFELLKSLTSADD